MVQLLLLYLLVSWRPLPYFDDSTSSVDRSSRLDFRRLLAVMEGRLRICVAPQPLLKLFQLLQSALLVALHLLQYVSLPHVNWHVLVFVLESVLAAPHVLLAVDYADIATVVEGPLVHGHLCLAQLLARIAEVMGLNRNNRHATPMHTYDKKVLTKSIKLVLTKGHLSNNLLC